MKIESLNRLLPSLPFDWWSDGRRHRRYWAGDGKAHIEVKTASRPGSEQFTSRLKDAVERLEGVDWAEVNGVAGRLVVAFDPESIDVGELVDAVTEVEDAAGVGDARFSHARSEHPGDRDSLRAAGLTLVADLAGMGLAATSSLLRATPIPTELGAVFGFIEDQPRIRDGIEERLGPVVTDVGLAVGNAVGLALSGGPLGLVVDAGHRLNLTVAARARLLLWEQREAELAATPETVATDPVALADRPVPLPRGPVETYLNRAGIAGLAGAGAMLVTTGSLRRAGAVMLASMGKPTRLGRETFSAQLERALARRGTVVLDPRAVRRLDRVDCLLVPTELLRTGRWHPEHVIVCPGAEHAEAHRHLRTLFDPDRPDRVRRRRPWSVGPLARLDPVMPAAASEAIVPLATDEPYVLCRDGEVVAAFDIAPEFAPDAHLIMEVAHENHLLVVVADDDSRTISRLHADVLVADGAHLEESVTALQRDGHVVAVLATEEHAALRRADVGIGLLDGGVVPWGADIVASAIDDVRFLLEACGVAHEVSRQGNAIALSGSSVASLFALTAPERSAGTRAANTVNVATIASMANALRAALLLSRRSTRSAGVVPRWHELARSEVLKHLDTSLSGLTDEEASRRRGPDVRLPPAPARFAMAVVAEMSNPLTPVLAGSAVLSATIGSVADAGIVFSVMALNGLISGIQRFAAEEAVRSLLQAGTVPAHVRRDGAIVSVTADELVPGDVVILEAGDTVPADCRILQATSLEVDESSLTGESDPVDKQTAASFAVLVNDRTSMLYAGTAIAAGSAVACVVAVGEATEAADNNGSPHHEGPAVGVEARLRELSAVSLPVAGASGVVVTLSQLWRGLPMERSLASGVSLAVAAVPEGLPMLATVGQLSAARRLSQRDVLVRNPRAVEALGRVDVLCADKTGTLTAGRVVVHTVSDGSSSCPLDDLTEHHRTVLRTAARACPNGNGERSLPHYTDRAVLTAAAQALDDVPSPTYEQLGELPFGPERPFHATWQRTRRGVELVIKGAPEYLLERCTHQLHSRGDRPISQADRAGLHRHVDALAREGLRVLAVARRIDGKDADVPHTPTEADLESLVLLGFVALADPVRPTAAQAVEGLREAGVDLVMVTGDHPSTAEGIAAQLGILDGRRVVTGTELERMTPADLAAILPEVSVFARVTPAHKMQIVSAFQRLGRSVAMTGDGANDAKAMRQADVGIAIGRHCTPAARSAADVIITDDRIETIVHAIVEGRALWASVRDALAILLGGNLGEIGFILLSGGIGGQPALSPRQILLVNLLTDVAPSLAIVSRPPPGRSAVDLAREGPDRSLGTKLNEAILQRAVATTAGATLGWSIARYTGSQRRASTVGLATLVGTQLGQTITAGHFDPVVAASALGSAGVLAAFIQIPGVSQFFGCTPLGPVSWSIVIGSSAGATIGALFLPERIDALLRAFEDLQQRHSVTETAEDSATHPG
ncbi:MAG: HAD-IC family P-type ATPase [Acidimicrobiales bacterium]